MIVIMERKERTRTKPADCLWNPEWFRVTVFDPLTSTFITAYDVLDDGALGMTEIGGTKPSEIASQAILKH